MKYEHGNSQRSISTWAYLAKTLWNLILIKKIELLVENIVGEKAQRLERADFVEEAGPS